MIGEMVSRIAEAGRDDNVLILAEEGLMSREIKEILSAFRKTSNAELMVYPDKSSNMPEYPKSVAKAMEASTVIIDCCMLTDMYSELKQNLLPGRKIIYLLKPFGKFLPYYEADKVMLEQVQDTTKRVAEFLKSSDEVEIAAGGSTFRARIGGRPIIVDGLSVEKGSDTILPMASVSFAPIETSLNGEWDFSGFVENVSGSSRAEVLSGKVVFRGGKISASEEIMDFFSEFDRECLNIGHITFGTNPFITSPFEGFDTERAAGGICLGFGNNQGVFSGANKSDGHIDLAMMSGSILLRNESGEEIRIGGDMTRQGGSEKL